MISEGRDEKAPGVMDDGYRLLKSRLCNLLDLIRIGVTYERAEGDRLFCRIEGREVEILDLVGGFGSTLLGHNHPQLVAEAQAILAGGRPIHAQGSRRGPAGRLALALSRRLGGGWRVILANSGAEAVEAAMKHAMAETRGRSFIALEHAFHGNTLGSVQLTASPEYREPFALAGLDVLRVRPNDLGSLEKAFAQARDLAGFVFEAVQGEGGVRPLEPAFLKRAAELCAARNVPLIADEIQCGMGRTGAFLACETLGVRPDYVMLSKSLGGGLAKVAALLIRGERYKDDFDLYHTSTYAEDDFSSAIALKTLDLLDDAAMERCRAKGELLLSGLRRIQERFPDVIAGVRGRGLMAGVEFRPLADSRSFTLRMLSAQEDLVLVAAGYLFNVHRIRVAPTLSDPWTLRLEPSSLIADSDLERFLAALENTCARLREGDALALTAYVVGPGAVPSDEGRPDEDFVFFDEPRFREREPDAPPVRVGWLGHLVDANDLAALDPQFGGVPIEDLEDGLRHFVTRACPVVMNSVDVRSATGARVRLHAILLPFTSRQMKLWLEERRLERPRGAVQNALEIARDLGCRLVALGQYTSIVTLNGTQLRRKNMGLTTGNSYAVALALEALERASADRSRAAGDSVLAVVGAAGNIGRACAEILAPRYRRVLLIGNNRPGARLRLEELARQIPNSRISSDPAAVRSADVVIAATNAVNTPLGPEHLAPGAIVCDLSVPATVRPDTAVQRPDLLLIKGGLCRLPGGEDLEIAGWPLPAGQTYGCMGEGLLLGYEGIFDTMFTGTITAEHVRRVAEMARRHGFGLADYKTECVLGTHPRKEEARVLLP